MEKPAVDIIIPIYKPDHTLCLLLQKLQEQTFVVHQVILANTEERLWEEYIQAESVRRCLEELSIPLELFHVAKGDFDHGGTRNLAVAKSQAPYFICMTQDALPVDEFLVERLMAPLRESDVAAVYARQQAREDCSPIEAYTHSFNYPLVDRIKSKEDIPALGIKTFFCSNVCAAYRRDIFRELGGFEAHTIFNEDMIYAAMRFWPDTGLAMRRGLWCCIPTTIQGSSSTGGTLTWLCPRLSIRRCLQTSAPNPRAPAW